MEGRSSSEWSRVLRQAKEEAARARQGWSSCRAHRRGQRRWKYGGGGAADGWEMEMIRFRVKVKEMIK